MIQELIQDIAFAAYIKFLRFRLHITTCRLNYWIDRERLADFNCQVADYLEDKS